MRTAGILAMKNLKALLGLGVVVAAFYVAWMVLPPYYAHYQFQDAVDNEAKTASYTTKSEDDIRESLAKTARGLDIPLRAEDIHVQRDGNEVSIWAEYQVHVDLPVHPLDLKFSPASKNRKI